MAFDCYATVRRCPQCVRSRIKLWKNIEQLQLFPSTSPLQPARINILGEFIRTKRGNDYLHVITETFTKMVKRTPLRGVSAAKVARHFILHWVFNYCPPIDFLADNGGPYSAKIFKDVCKLMRIHNNYTTMYPPQENGLVER